MWTESWSKPHNISVNAEAFTCDEVFAHCGIVITSSSRGCLHGDLKPNSNSKWWIYKQEWNILQQPQGGDKKPWKEQQEWGPGR